MDGFDNYYLMYDANVPSLLAILYLGNECDDDEIYLNTRKFLLSKDNPYFFKGNAGEGIGGIWPMGIIMRAMQARVMKR